VNPTKIDRIAGGATNRLLGKTACVDIGQRKGDNGIDVIAAFVDEGEPCGNVFRAYPQILDGETNVPRMRQYESAGAKFGRAVVGVNRGGREREHRQCRGEEQAYLRNRFC
jgi:hypothetical protein